MAELAGEERFSDEAGPKYQTSLVVATENEAGESRQVALDAVFSSLPANSMDGEKLALEERLAPAPTTTSLVREDIELCSPAVVISYAETTTFHPEHNHTFEHDFGMPADLKQSSNSASEEGSMFTHDEKYMSSSRAKPEESLEDLLTVAHDSCRPPTPSELEESLKCEAKEVSMVAEGSPSSAYALKLEEMSKFATTDISMVDSVTDNLVKVSIRHAMNSNGEHMPKQCGKSLENGKGSRSQSEEGCHSMLAIEKGGASTEKISPDDEPLRHTAGVGKIQVESCKDNKLVCSIKERSRLDSNKDADGDNDDADSVMEEIEEDLDEGVKQKLEDSDSSSSTSTLCFSSSSDDEEADKYRFPNNLNQELVEMLAESECEEGELKESPSQRKKATQRKKTSVKEKALAESSEDEGGLKEPVRSRNEMKAVPRVPKVSVTLQPYHTTVPAGIVSSVVGVSLIVEGIEGQQALSEGSILWLTEQRSPLGIVDELFGPVKKPFYVVRYNDASELPEEAKEGAQVSFVRDFADFVLNNPDLYAKGYDNSAEVAEDLSDSDVYFSDDEKEAEYKRSKPRMKRGNLELRTPDTDMRQHQERRTQGKRSSKDNRNQRSKGDNASTFWSNNNFSGKPPRHQNSSFQHRQSERDPPFQRRQGDTEPPSQRRQGEREPPFFHIGVEPMQKSNDRQFENRSPVRQVRSQQSLRVGQPKSSTSPRHTVSVLDEVGVGPKKASPRPTSHEVQPTQSNQSSQSTSWEPQPPQTAQSRSCMQPASPQRMSQSSDFMQATSHKAQMHQPHSVLQSTSQQEQTNLPHTFTQSTLQIAQVNQPHSFMQPALQQVVPLQPQNHLQSTPQQGQMINQSPVLPHSQAWHMNQPVVPLHMSSPQLPGVQHSQMPVCNAAVVVGQVSQVAGSGYGLPSTNNVPIQSGIGMGQGVLPMHQPPIFQQVPLQKQISSFGAHQFSAQASPNIGMQMGNQVHADGYPMGVQPAASFSAPVLGIPVGPAASAPSNYVVHNQQYSGFSPGCAPAYGNGPPSTYDHPRPMQQPMQLSAGTSAGSWQQQNIPQGGTWQQPYQQRPPQGRAPYRSPRF